MRTEMDDNMDKSYEEGNVCQVRRKIEDYHEQRRFKDELGEFGLE